MVETAHGVFDVMRGDYVLFCCLLCFYFILSMVSIWRQCSLLRSIMPLILGGIMENKYSKAAGKGIHIKKSHRGLLHHKLGIPQDERIPEARLLAARRSSSPSERKEANFAINFGH